MTTSTGCNHPNLHVPFTPKHQYAYSLYCSLYISKGNDKENFFNKQEALQLVIIPLLWPYCLIQEPYFSEKLDAGKY